MWLTEPNDNLEPFTKEWGKLNQTRRRRRALSTTSNRLVHSVSGWPRCWSMKLNRRGWSFSSLFWVYCSNALLWITMTWFLSLSGPDFLPLLEFSESFNTYLRVMAVVISFTSFFFLLDWLFLKYEECFLFPLFLWCAISKSSLSQELLWLQPFEITPELLSSRGKYFKMGITESLGRSQTLTRSPGRKGISCDALAVGLGFCQRFKRLELHVINIMRKF